MGLKKTYITNQGFTATNAYHRIQNVRGENDGSVRYNVEVYYDKPARDSGQKPITLQRKLVPGTLMSNIGVVHELYEILKKETDYSGATDVFELGTFLYYDNQYITNAYILSADLDDGYTVTAGNVTDAIFDGKFIIGGQVVTGVFTHVNATNVVADGYNVVQQGFVTDGYADGYGVQNLII